MTENHYVQFEKGSKQSIWFDREHATVQKSLKRYFSSLLRMSCSTAFER